MRTTYSSRIFLFGGGGVGDKARPLARGVLNTLLLILDTLISIFLFIMQWDEKELDTKFTPNFENFEEFGVKPRFPFSTQTVNMYL